MHIIYTQTILNHWFLEYLEELYERIDIPNIHVYPAQGWKKKYPEDTMRSAMYNYGWASKRFWDNFEKPAIFGEAGADLAYFSPNDSQYHIAYHNQLWASLSNGLAATPIWWDYPVLTDSDWDQLKNLAGFVSDLDLANQPYQPLTATSNGADLYVLGTTNIAFGSQLYIRNIENKTYHTVYIKEVPNIAILHHSLGLSYIRAKAYVKADKELKKAVELDPNNARFSYVYAVSMGEKNPKKAIDILEKAYKKSTGDMQIVSGLVYYSKQVNDTAKSTKYEKILRSLQKFSVQ